MVNKLMSLLLLFNLFIPALSVVEFQVIGEYEFDIFNNTQEVKLYTSVDSVEKISKILQSEEKSNFFEEMKIFDSCLYEGSIQPQPDRIQAVSLYLLTALPTEPKLSICRLINETALIGKVEDLQSIERFLETFEDFLKNLEISPPFKTQVFIISAEKLDQEKIIRDQNFCDFGCLECFKTDNFQESCKKCLLGFFQDPENPGKCIKCKKSLRFCEKFNNYNEKTGFIDGLMQTNRALSCQCSTASCSRKLNNENICSDCSSKFCSFCNAHVDDPLFSGYNPENRICLNTSSQTCFSYCTKCSKNCTECEIGRPLINGVCQNCTSCANCYPNCKECNSDWSGCKTCESNYFLENGTCKNCSSSCSACFSNCSTCSDTECNKCLSGYFLSYTLCKECKSWCSRCFGSCNSCDNTQCFRCYSGSFLNGSLCVDCKVDCSRCDSNCITCSSYSCLSCKPGFFVDYWSCYKCSKTCNKCFENCLECSDYTCTKCNVGYFLLDTKCVSCDKKYKNCTTCESFTCLSCISGYSLSLDNLECIVHDSISLSFMPSFVEILVKFYKNMTSLLLEDVFEGDLDSIFGESYIFTQLNGTDFELQLGRNYDPNLYKLVLVINCMNLKQKQFYCGQLRVKIDSTNQEFPYPITEIRGPDEIDLSVDSFVYFYSYVVSGHLRNIMRFSWFRLDNQHAISNQSWILMKSSDFVKKFDKVKKGSVLKINLYSSNIYQRDFKQFKFVKLINNTSVNVEIGKSEDLQCAFDQDCQIFISKITTRLTNPQFEFKWYLLKPGTKIQSDYSSHSLSIGRNSLKPTNNPYRFKLNVLTDSGKLIFQKIFSVKIRRIAPIANMGRPFGGISKDEDLVLNATLSYNPNSFSSQDLSFEWVVNIRDQPQIIHMKPVLIVDKSNFTEVDSITTSLTVCDRKSKNLCSQLIGNFNISNQNVPKVQINEYFSNLPLSRVSKSGPVIFKASAEEKEIMKKIKWTLDNEYQVSGSDYIWIPEQNLISGKSHQLTFSVEVGKDVYNFYVSFIVNQAPIQGKLILEPTAGNEYYDLFAFAAAGYHDSENDYPLIYEFGLKNTNFEISFLAQQQQIYSSFLSYYHDDLNAFVLVCDSLNDCSYTETDIVIFPTFEKIDLLNKAIKEITLIHNIPLVISGIFYSCIINGQFALDHKKRCFSYCLEKLKEFLAASKPNQFIIKQTFQLLKIFTSKTNFFYEIDKNGYSISEEKSKNTLKVLEIIYKLLELVKKNNLYFSYSQLVLDLIEKVVIIDFSLKSSERFEIFCRSLEITQEMNAIIFHQMIKRENFQYSRDYFIIGVSKLDENDESYFYTTQDQKSLIFLKQNDSNLNFTDQNIVISFSYFKSNKYFDDLVALRLFNDSSNEYVLMSNLPATIDIEIPISVYLDSKNLVLDCMYLNFQERKWLKAGCELKQLKNDSIVCTCSASVFSQPFIPYISIYEYNVIKPSENEHFIYNQAIYTSLGCYLLFVFFFSICVSLDTKNLARVQNVRPQENSNIRVLYNNYMPSSENYRLRNRNESHTICEIIVSNSTIANIFFKINENISRTERCLKLILRMTISLFTVSFATTHLNITNESDSNNDMKKMIIWILSFQTIISLVLYLMFFKINFKFVMFQILGSLILILFIMLNFDIELKMNKNERVICSLSQLFYLSLEIFVIDPIDRCLGICISNIFECICS